jgi:hypothetical protein
MASIAASIARIKQDALGTLERGVVEEVCAEFGHQWRDRELDPVTTVALFVQQVLHGNVACSEVRHLASAAGNGNFTASAYCQARARLPLAVVQSLLTRVCEASLVATRQPSHLWLGRRRVFHVDGATFSMPDTPELRQAFGLPHGPKPGCGFPMAHLLVLFHAQTGLLLDAWASPLRTGDIAQVAKAHARLEAGDVLIGDESFSSYAHLAMLMRLGVHGLFPLHRKRVVDSTRGRPHSTARCVEYFKPPEVPPWMRHLLVTATFEDRVGHHLRYDLAQKRWERLHALDVSPSNSSWFVQRGKTLHLASMRDGVRANNGWCPDGFGAWQNASHVATLRPLSRRQHGRLWSSAEFGHPRERQVVGAPTGGASRASRAAWPNSGSESAAGRRIGRRQLSGPSCRLPRPRAYGLGNQIGSHDFGLVRSEGGGPLTEDPRAYSG